MNTKGCESRVLSVAYPKHARRPEDILNFIESDEFVAAWDRLDLNCEDDAVSLQLCTMANPKDWPVIAGTGGLRLHIHSFRDTGIDKPDIGAYYVYFEDFGIVYFVFLDATAEQIDFSASDLDRIRAGIARIRALLEQRKRIR
jgi:hypothetical protein